MSKIVNAEIERIRNNPFRMLEKYPYSEEKLAALSEITTRKRGTH